MPRLNIDRLASAAKVKSEWRILRAECATAKLFAANSELLLRRLRRLLLLLRAGAAAALWAGLRTGAAL